MKQPKIVLIDYEIGNIHSISNALNTLGYKKFKISNNATVISDADVLILPGVGSFDETIKNLFASNLVDLLNEEVLIKKKPILGICVGMQMMATSSDENGLHNGLNWIEGFVTKLDLPNTFSVPHVGWNNLNIKVKDPLFANLERETNFYFDHSYHYICDEKYITSTCDYGFQVTASIQKENIFGVQFHPEKSQISGLKLFRGFFNSI